MSVIGVAGIILLVMKPLVVMIVQRTPEGALLDEASVVSVLLMAFACGFMCMMIGFDFIIRRDGVAGRSPAGDDAGGTGRSLCGRVANADDHSPCRDAN
ncbi:hypothetical protein Cni_G06232 [Canna indica]|uniref:Uncharacterized protein n=1 Tax=Canna indica TaxID=4628 RepID=A0AAQ3Q6B6_9LILI|nr:hypothetical protein Cni_G06232 [Canna indica]